MHAFRFAMLVLLAAPAVALAQAPPQTPADPPTSSPLPLCSTVRARACRFPTYHAPAQCPTESFVSLSTKCQVSEELWAYKHAGPGMKSAAADQLCLDYMEGWNGHTYFAKALPWCQKAAVHGYPFIFSMVGSDYETGNKVPQNYTYALDWYTRGAELGVHDAQYALARMYWRGEGARANVMKAAEWLIIARANSAGSNNFIGVFDTPSLSTVEAKMTRAQITQAQNFAAVWWQQHHPDCAGPSHSGDAQSDNAQCDRAANLHERATVKSHP